jgi:hypothetical protein
VEASIAEANKKSRKIEVCCPPRGRLDHSLNYVLSQHLSGTAIASGPQLVIPSFQPNAMSNQNWFNAAAGSNARPLGVSQFQTAGNNSTFSTPTRPTFNNNTSSQNIMSPGLFASTSNTSSIGMGSVAGSGGYGNGGYAGQQGDQISKALIEESEALGKKYMESYTPGAKKKQVAVSDRT